MISAVLSVRLAGLDRIKSGFTSRFANRLPIFGASRLPRSFNGRSLSGNAVSSQLDFAWRMRNSVFIPRPRVPDAAQRERTHQRFHKAVAAEATQSSLPRLRKLVCAAQLLRDRPKL